MKKPRKKPRKDPAARPLAGAEVLVAVGEPSPGEGGGKKSGGMDLRAHLRILDRFLVRDFVVAHLARAVHFFYFTHEGLDNSWMVPQLTHEIQSETLEI